MAEEPEATVRASGTAGALALGVHGECATQRIDGSL